MEEAEEGCRWAVELRETEGVEEEGQEVDGLARGPKDAEALGQAAGEASAIVLKAAKGLTAK